MGKHDIDIDRAFGPPRDLEREQREESERVALLHRRGAPSLSIGEGSAMRRLALSERVEGRTHYTLYFTKELKLALKTAAAQHGTTMRAIIVRAIKRELKRLAKGE